MNWTRPFAVFGLATATAICVAQSTIIDRYAGLVVGKLFPSVQVTATRSATGGYRVKFPSYNSNLLLQLPQGTSWANFTHVDLRITNNGTSPAQLEMDISSKSTAGWLSTGIVIGVGESLNVSVPFQTASVLGLKALPSITDSVRSQTASVGNIFATDVNGFYFWNKDTQSADITIETMGLNTHRNSTVGFVDTFGQQARLNWKGKVASIADLKAARQAETFATTFPYPADKYGGMSDSKKYTIGTAFRTVKDNGRWYLITPAGNRFFSLGVNEIGAQAWTPVQTHEEMFTDLPNLKASYSDAWSTRSGLLGFIPYQVNLERKYLTTWRSLAETTFIKRMKTWGFNTVGINSWDTLVSHQQMTSTFGGAIEGTYKTFPAYDNRVMPDVFDPQFATDTLSTCQSRISQTGGANSMNLGIFIDNELPWGNKLLTDVHYRYALAVGALRATTTFSHTQFVNTLKTQYVTVTALNKAWGTSFASWKALDTAGVDVPTAGTATMTRDFAAFGYQYAKKYFSTVKASLQQLNFKGLYLGCRFTATEFVPEVIDAAKESCDVISVNIYNASPSAIAPELRSLDFPILISEFCFGASDYGRVGMPLFPSQTEAARIDCYRRFVEEVKTWPNIVGAHWYRWEDFPATAKLDSDNMSEGLISITDTPYYGLTDQAKQSAISLMLYLKGLP